MQETKPTLSVLSVEKILEDHPMLLPKLSRPADYISIDCRPAFKFFTEDEIKDFLILLFSRNENRKISSISFSVREFPCVTNYGQGIGGNTTNDRYIGVEDVVTLSIEPYIIKTFTGDRNIFKEMEASSFEKKLI